MTQTRTASLGGITITDGVITGVTSIAPSTDIAIADGGTGQSTAAAALAALMPPSTYSSNQVLVAADTNAISKSGAQLTTEASPVTGQIHFIKNASTTLYCLIVFGGSKNFDGATTSFPLLPGEFMCIQYDGTEWWSIAGVGRASVRKVASIAAVTFNNTITETDVVNVTVPGKLMSANGSLYLHIPAGYILNNTGSTRTARMRHYIGGATQYDGGAANFGATASKQYWHDSWFHMKNQAATNANRYGEGRMWDPIGTPTTGVGTGSIGATGGRWAHATTAGDMAIDTSADFAIRMTWELNNASVNYEVSHIGGELIYVPG